MIVSAAWIVPAILGAVDSSMQQVIWGGGGPNGAFNVRDVIFTSIDWLLYGFLTPFVFLLAHRFPITRPRLGRNARLHLVFSLGFCVAWASAGTLLKLAIQPNSFGNAGVRTFWVGWIFTTLPFGVAVYLAVVGIEHAIRYFVESRERETQLARLSEQLTGARLAALQAQLNPHFLFNSLNTIAVLVRDENTAAATRVIEQLSDVLRTTLGRSRNSEVSLDDELELVRQYLAVEQARFSDRMRPEFRVSSELLSAAVPSFALQHLVENAVRHGIARRSDSGRIIVSARRDGETLEISVQDDGAGVAPGLVPQPGHGIENTRERLRTLYGESYGDRATLEVEPMERGTIATIRIPYHELVLEAAHAEQRVE